MKDRELPLSRFPKDLPVCRFEGCKNVKIYVHGLCVKHYQFIKYRVTLSQREMEAKYRLLNREKHNQQVRESRIKNNERVKLYDRLRYLTNIKRREYCRITNKQYKKKHKSQLKRKNHIYYLLNKEKITKQIMNNYKKHKKEIYLQNRIWVLRNINHVRKYHQVYGKTWRAKNRKHISECKKQHYIRNLLNED